MVPSPDQDRVRTAEVSAALCLATDLGMGLPVEQGLQATVVAMRVAERLGVDEATARQTFFGCLLFYAGCTADAEIQAILFPEGALLERWTPVMFGSSREATVGVLTALAAGEGTWPKRVETPRTQGATFRRRRATSCTDGQACCDSRIPRPQRIRAPDPSASCFPDSS